MTAWSVVLPAAWSSETNRSTVIPSIMLMRIRTKLTTSWWVSCSWLSGWIATISASEAAIAFAASTACVTPEWSKRLDHPAAKQPLRGHPQFQTLAFHWHLFLEHNHFCCQILFLRRSGDSLGKQRKLQRTRRRSGMRRSWSSSSSSSSSSRGTLLWTRRRRRRWR